MATPPRPKIDKEMILRAAEQVMPEGAESIAAEYSYPMDGFELCKALDKWQGWDSTRDDMDELDRMDLIVHRMLEEAEKAWFEAYDIKPPLPIGAKVIVRRGEKGEITGIDQHGHGKYLVKPDGQDDEKAGHRRYIINFEDAQPA